MSTAQDLSQQLEALAQATEEQVALLQTVNQELSDQSESLSAQIDNTQTGRDVAQSFQAAIQSVEEAFEQLQTAAQSARDYAQGILAM